MAFACLLFLSTTRAALDWVIPDDIQGFEIAREYRIAKSGREVWFVTTEVLWYALRVYIQDENRATKLLRRTGHYTLEDVQTQINEVLEDL